MNTREAINKTGANKIGAGTSEPGEARLRLLYGQRRRSISASLRRRSISASLNATRMSRLHFENSSVPSVFSVVTENSVSSSMPHREVSMPHRGVSMPHRGVSMPYRGVSMPYREVSMPHRGVSMPYRGVSKLFRDASVRYRGDPKTFREPRLSIRRSVQYQSLNPIVIARNEAIWRYKTSRHVNEIASYLAMTAIM